MREERPGHWQRAWRIGGSPEKCGEAEREVVRPKGKKEVVALEEPSMAWSSSALPSGHHAREVVDRSRIRRLVVAPMAMEAGSGGGGLAGFLWRPAPTMAAGVASGWKGLERGGHGR